LAIHSKVCSVAVTIPTDMKEPKEFTVCLLWNNPFVLVCVLASSVFVRSYVHKAQKLPAAAEFAF